MEQKHQNKIDQLKTTEDVNSYLSSTMTKLFPALGRKRRKRNILRNYPPSYSAPMSNGAILDDKVMSILYSTSLTNRRRNLSPKELIKFEDRNAEKSRVHKNHLSYSNVQNDRFIHDYEHQRQPIENRIETFNGVAAYNSFTETSDSKPISEQKKNKKHNVRHARKKGHHREITRKFSQWILEPEFLEGSKLSSVQEPVEPKYENYNLDYKSDLNLHEKNNTSHSNFHKIRKNKKIHLKKDLGSLSKNSSDLESSYFPSFLPWNNSTSEKTNNLTSSSNINDYKRDRKASKLKRKQMYSNLMNQNYSIDNQKILNERLQMEKDIYVIDELLTNKSTFAHQGNGNWSENSLGISRFDYGIDDLDYQPKPHHENSFLPFGTEEALLLAIPLSLVITLVVLTLIVCCCCYKRRQDRNHLGLIAYEDIDLNPELHDPPVNCCGCRVFESCCLPDLSYQLHRAEWVKRHSFPAEKIFDPYLEVEQHPSEDDFHPSLYDLLSNLPPQRPSSTHIKCSRRLKPNLRKTKSVELLFG